MFGDAQSPAELSAWCGRVGACQLGDALAWNAGDLLGVVEGVGLDAFGIFVEAARSAIDELAVFQSGCQDLTPDGVGQRNIRADVEPKPGVGPARRTRAARIDDVQLCAVAYASQDVVKEDRMRFPRIRTPENDDAGVLSLFVGAGATARAEDRRQTDDARSVSR